MDVHFMITSDFQHLGLTGTQMEVSMEEPGPFTYTNKLKAKGIAAVNSFPEPGGRDRDSKAAAEAAAMEAAKGILKERFPDSQITVTGAFIRDARVAGQKTAVWDLALQLPQQKVPQLIQTWAYRDALQPAFEIYGQDGMLTEGMPYLPHSQKGHQQRCTPRSSQWRRRSPST